MRPAGSGAAPAAAATRPTAIVQRMRQLYARVVHTHLDNPAVADGVSRMIFLGFGKYVRADKIYALEPLGPGARGHGARTRVWVEGIAEPIVASRTERAIVAAMGGNAAAESRLVGEALDLAPRAGEAAG